MIQPVTEFYGFEVHLFEVDDPGKYIHILASLSWQENRIWKHNQMIMGVYCKI